MSKKIIYSVIGVILIAAVILSIFTVTRNDYEYKEGDFSLTISVDKTKVQVGDFVEVTTILKNLSGRNVHIQMSMPFFRTLESMILLGSFKECEGHYFGVPSLGGRRIKKTIKRDAVIIKTIKCRLDELINYEVVSQVGFYTGKGYKNHVGINSEVLIITVNSVS